MKTKLLTLVTLVFIGLNTANAQVGIGTNTPDASAGLDVNFNDKGFLPPRLTTAQRDENILNPAEGLTIYNTDQKCSNVYVGLGWRNLCAVVGANDVINPQTGKIWMDRNLGANQVATFSTDAASYGDLYQWGRAADGHEKISRVAGDDPTSDNYTVEHTGVGVANFNSPGGAWDGEFITRSSGDNNWVNPSVSGVDDLWQGVNGTNNPCPSGYRVPSEAELDLEHSSWSSNNAAGAFASPLKLPVAGLRQSSNGLLGDVGATGRYWSSTVSSPFSRFLFFGSSFANVGDSRRANGLSVRCLKD